MTRLLVEYKWQYTNTVTGEKYEPTTHREELFTGRPIFLSEIEAILKNHPQRSGGIVSDVRVIE